MKTVLSTAVAALSVLFLGGCQTPSPHANSGSSGLKVLSGTQSQEWDVGSELLLPRHPNRATREPQFIPD